ncbi:hypothetical protein EBS43_08145 [bacterium]|jgi:hypothetical protein|nr:hypothetical protein [bacterium]
MLSLSSSVYVKDGPALVGLGPLKTLFIVAGPISRDIRDILRMNLIPASWQHLVSLEVVSCQN